MDIVHDSHLTLVGVLIDTVHDSYLMKIIEGLSRLISSRVDSSKTQYLTGF